MLFDLEEIPQIVIVQINRMQTSNHQLSQSPKRKFENIFKVRRVHQTLVRDKYIKPDFQNIRKEVEKVNHEGQKSPKAHKKNADYHYHFLIVSSPQYKELSRKFKQLKQDETQRIIQRQIQIKTKTQELDKYRDEYERLARQRERLEQRQQQLRRRIQYLRYRRQHITESMDQDQGYEQQEDSDCVIRSLFGPSSQQRYMSLQGLRDMVLSLRYQNGIDINPDQMTYEELLQLQEKMGSVSKGLTVEQINRLQRFQVDNQNKEEMLCSICYQNAGVGDTLNKLPCSHIFHVDCVKQWLCKEKICPMCKQQINIACETLEVNKTNKSERMIAVLNSSDGKCQLEDQQNNAELNIGMCSQQYNFMNSQQEYEQIAQQVQQYLDCGSNCSQLNESIMGLNKRYQTERNVEGIQVQDNYECIAQDHSLHQ